MLVSKIKYNLVGFLLSFICQVETDSMITWSPWLDFASTLGANCVGSFLHHFSAWWVLFKQIMNSSIFTMERLEGIIFTVFILDFFDTA